MTRRGRHGETRHCPTGLEGSGVSVGNIRIYIATDLACWRQCINDLPCDVASRSLRAKIIANQETGKGYHRMLSYQDMYLPSSARGTAQDNVNGNELQAGAHHRGGRGKSAQLWPILRPSLLVNHRVSCRGVAGAQQLHLIRDTAARQPP